jgi:hypothetical protein
LIESSLDNFGEKDLPGGVEGNLKKSGYSLFLGLLHSFFANPYSKTYSFKLLLNIFTPFHLSALVRSYSLR